jgi:hypothetical protein
MNAPPPVILRPLAICLAGQKWMSPVETSAGIQEKSLLRSMCTTSVVLEDINPPFQVSSSCAPPSLKPQLRSCFKTVKKTKEAEAANPTVIRLRSITFDENVRVRMVAYTTSTTRADRLWYRDSDYERFRTKIVKLATLAKQYQQEHGKKVHLPGMERWIVEDTDTATAKDFLSTARLRSQAIGSVLMEQFCQRQKGQINHERISALYRLTTMQAHILAWERAATMRNYLS